MTIDTLLLFVLTSLLLAVTPGPTMLLALSNGISGGMRRAGWGIAGASIGSTAVITAVALGLGSLMAASEFLFNALRVAGVLYLVWLGVKLWRSQPPDVRAALAEQGKSPQGGRTLLRSLAVALSNPKSVIVSRGKIP